MIDWNQIMAAKRWVMGGVIVRTFSAQFFGNFGWLSLIACGQLWKRYPSRDADVGAAMVTDMLSRASGSGPLCPLYAGPLCTQAMPPIEAQVTCVLQSTIGSPKWEDASPGGSGSQSLPQVPGIDISIAIACNIPSEFGKGTSSWAGASLNW